MTKDFCFEKKHIQGFRKKYKKANSEYIEKTIYAFELLSMLQATKMEFVFKGGTSMLLILPEPLRLSIDVDIVGEIDITNFRAMIKNSRFLRFEEDERIRSNYIKHYKFYYNSVFSPLEQYILLDVILKKHNFPEIERRTLQSPFLEFSSLTEVNVPGIESLLADKLTAFAPNTIGIPYDEKSNSRTIGIIKQLHDISILFDYSKDLNLTKKTYQASYHFELDLRDEKYSISECLQDTIDTAFLISQSRLKGSEYNEKLEIIDFGCRNFSNYLLDGSFSIDKAKVPASKAAFLASLILNDREIEIDKIKYNSTKIEQIKNVLFTGKYQILNKLKAISPEAFYYWHLVSQIEERII